MTDFETWWHREGSALRPLPGEDAEQHARRVADIAWSNGAYKEREACLAEIELGIWIDLSTEEILDAIAKAIRGRHQPQGGSHGA